MRAAGGTRSGAALVMALLLLLLLDALAVLALVATRTRMQLAGDDRLASEGWLVAASALAEVRLSQQGPMNAMPDGARVALGWSVRGDGWRWRADLVREGEIVRVTATAELRGADGMLRASRRLTLLLDRLPSDTVRVLAHRPRM